MQGYNIHLGRDVYVNFGAVFLDCNTIHIGWAMEHLWSNIWQAGCDHTCTPIYYAHHGTGDRCLLAPNVQLYTAGHPLDPVQRSGTSGPEFAQPIRIGNDCWVVSPDMVAIGVASY